LAFFAALPADLRRNRMRTLDISYCPRITPGVLDTLASNPAQLPHTIELYDCPQMSKQHIGHFLASIPSNRTQVEFHDYKWMSVKEIKALCESFECSFPCPTTYIMAVCTVRVRTSSMWYPGCSWPKCYKKVEEYHGVDGQAGREKPQQWLCHACNRVSDRFVNRYMASIHVMDHTGDCWLRAFDEAATPLLGISAQELSHIKAFDETLFEDKIKEAQLQRHELRLKVVQEEYRGRCSAKPYLLSSQPIAAVSAAHAAALAKWVEAYLWMDYLAYF